MAKRGAAFDEKKIVAGRCWLNYYNNALFEKGIISERERNRMALKIAGWTGCGY